jgi:hypothetical protein
MSDELTKTTSTSSDIANRAMDIISSNPDKAIETVGDFVDGLIRLTDKALDIISDAGLEAYKIDAQRYIMEIDKKITQQQDIIEKYQSSVMRLMDYVNTHEDNPTVVEIFKSAIESCTSVYNKALEESNKTTASKHGIFDIFKSKKNKNNE